jgi:glycosyltransferase involved in cell wall biosynthesis
MFPPSNRFNALPIEISELTYNVKFTYNALQLLKMEKPDFLYQRSSTLNYSGMALSVILGIPLFLEFNSSAVWDKGGHGKVPFYLMKLLVEKINLLSAEKIFVVSAVLKKKLTSAGIPEDKIIINPNGVDPSVFNPKVDNGIVRAEYNLNEKNIIGFIGVFGQWHGVDTLVKAIPHVIDANRNVHFLIIGDGYLRKRLDEIVEQNNVGAFITFTGVIPYSSVPKYLNACDILASPHRNMADGANFFGSPVKIFEYMAMEKPIVASNLHQLGEVLKDGETALLATPDDEESLADAILRLISDHALRTRLGINARKEVIKNYTWQRNAERVIEAYWQLGNKSKN